MLESPYVKPPVLPSAEHPRLMLRKCDLPRIRNNLNRSGNALAVSVWEELCSHPIRGEGATPEFGSYDLAEALAVEALAFKALLSGKKADAGKAISSAELLLSRFEVKGGNMGARWGGHIIFVCSEVYDWCYSFMPAETKPYFIEKCEEIAAAYFEMGYPPSRQTAISGHGAEAQLLRDLLAFSIAVYDERPDIYGFCAGRIFDEYVPEVNIYLSGGAHPQGPAYGSYRWTFLAWAELLFEKMAGRPAFGCLENTAEWLFYMTRPDGEALRLGDDFNELKDEYNRKAPFTVPFFYAYALTGRADFYEYFKKGLCREYLLPKHTGMDFYSESSWGEGCLSAVSLLIFDEAHGKASEKPFPCCRYFGSPVGATVFKKDETYIFMKAGEFWGSNHDHLDTGCFQIYQNAPLLTDSGVYDSYNSAHRLNYLIKTAAHNCITVEDKTADGGTRVPASGREPNNSETAFSKEYRMAYVTSHTESDSGCELFADLSPAYTHTCEKATRKMSYSHNSKTFTVEDEIVSFDENAKKSLHLHCQSSPVIQGNTIIFENRGGRAVCEVISPENACIEFIGGEGHQFEISKKNYPPDPPYTAEEGFGQVKITAVKKTKRTVFRIKIKLLQG